MRTSNIDTRIKKIVGLINNNKKVLNVGCAQNPIIHDLLTKKSSLCVGIDINKKGVQRLEQKGHKTHVMDAEKINLDEKFDYIIGGELIEHLSNPGLFLDASYRHLNKNGQLIITTPNISSIFLYLLVVVFDKTQDSTHVYYFDKKNLQVLVERHQYKIRHYYYLPPEIKFHGNGIFFKMAFFISTFFSNIGFYFNQRLFGSYLLMVLEKNE